MKTALSSSDQLKSTAALVSCRILMRGGTLKEYEDNQKSLLNNPQWRKKMAGEK